MEKMTRQRKWLLGVLGVGVAAVIVDQTLMGAPSAAHATDGAEPPAAPLVDASAAGDASATPPTTPSTGTEPIDLSAFSRRLSELPPIDAGESDRVDAFAPPAAWVVEQAAVVTPPEAAPQAISAEAFALKYRLTGTMNADGVQIAVLGSEPYRVGMRVDGFILRHVASRLAVWESLETGESIVLRETE